LFILKSNLKSHQQLMAFYYHACMLDIKKNSKDLGCFFCVRPSCNS
jgi:hypothetical protein